MYRGIERKDDGRWRACRENRVHVRSVGHCVAHSDRSQIPCLSASAEMKVREAAASTDTMRARLRGVGQSRQTDADVVQKQLDERQI